MRIIHGDQVFGMPYDSLLFLSNIERLHQRRADAGKTVFHTLCPQSLSNLIMLCVLCVDISLLFRSMHMYYDLWTVLYSFMDIMHSL